MTFIGSLDQGTTSTRFIVFSDSGEILGQCQIEHQQILPKPGWVEHNADEIWQNTQKVISGAISNAKISISDLAAIGITNQRETTVVWNRKTGLPIYNAIVWQDRRTADFCDQLKKEGKQAFIQEKIRFNDIPRLIESVLEVSKISDVTDLEMLVATDKQARLDADEWIAKLQ